MADEMKARALKSLGDPTRLHIVEFLSGCCCGRAEVDDAGAVYSPTAGEVCCHLTGAERITSTISHHLHELEASGLIRLEKRGKHTLCSLDPKSLESLADYLRDLARGGGNECC